MYDHITITKDLNLEFNTIICYDSRVMFNVECKAECDQLNLAHVTRNKKYKKSKQTPVPT